jgi:hypothetical protein
MRRSAIPCYGNYSRGLHPHFSATGKSARRRLRELGAVHETNIRLHRFVRAAVPRMHNLVLRNGVIEYCACAKELILRPWRRGLQLAACLPS